MLIDHVWCTVSRYECAEQDVGVEGEAYQCARERAHSTASVAMIVRLTSLVSALAAFACSAESSRMRERTAFSMKRDSSPLRSTALASDVHPQGLLGFRRDGEIPAISAHE